MHRLIVLLPLLALVGCSRATEASAGADLARSGSAPERRSALTVGERGSASPATAAAPQVESLLAGEVTYHNRISRIVRARCEGCHRDGSAAPFALDSYASVKKKRRMIEWVLDQGIMPPWFADEHSGPWSNDTSLPADERAELLAWLEAGAPEGDPRDAPPPAIWNSGWTIGEPDYIVEMQEDFPVPAEGVVDYQKFWVKTDFPEDRWVRAVEVQPGAKDVVHHVFTFIEDPEIYERRLAGDQEAKRLWQNGSDTYFASMGLGQSGLVYPPGTGKRLPAGAWIKFQVHYTPSGTATTDRSRMGLVFYDEPVEREIRTASAINQGFAIPPGAQDYEVTASYRFEVDAVLLSLLPHAHLRGTRFEYDLSYPDGRTETLLAVDPFRFEWQLNYEFATPRAVPRGTTLLARCWYDNSANNPANPDPTVTVRFGRQSFDEMMIGYVNFVAARPGELQGQ